MKLTRIPFAFLIAALAACSGGTATTNSTGSSSGAATIDGRVSGATSALRVEVAGTTSATTTDSSGAFALVGVPAGASALHFTGGSTDATLSIEALISSEHRTVSVVVSGNSAKEQHEQTGSEFHGKVDAIAAPNLTVAGRTVVTSSATKFEKSGAAAAFTDLKLGDQVEVHGALQADGTVVASAIEDGVPEPEHDDIMFVATLTKIDGNTLTVGDIPVVVSSATRLEKADKAIALGDLKVGDRLGVKGKLQPGPSVQADEIRVVVPDQEPEHKIAGPLKAISLDSKTLTIGDTTIKFDANTQVNGAGDPKSPADLHLGDLLFVEAAAQSDGSLLAKEIHRLPVAPPPDPGAVELHGVIKSLAADGKSFTINDATIAVNDKTAFGGAGDPKSLADFKVGDAVGVKAAKQADGSLVALGVFRLPPPPPPPPATIEFKGTIEAVSGDGLTVSGHRFAVDAHTTIRIGDHTATMADLKAGQTAELHATPRDGALPPLAVGIQVQP